MSKLSISEPWDFEAPQGGNELLGKVIRRLDAKSLIFEAEDIMTIKDLSSRYWLLTARYEKQSFDSEPYQGTVNGTLLPALPSDHESHTCIKKSGIFAIIGSLQD